MLITPTQSDIQTALGQFLQKVIPAGTPIDVAMDNRVPEAKAPVWLLMTPIRYTRIATNLDTYADVLFQGSIAGNIMTVSDVAMGLVVPGAQLFGVDVATTTTILAQIGGDPGGIGTYTVSAAQTLTERELSSGVKLVTIESLAAFQLDFHSVDTTAADLAQMFAATFRDEFATSFFSALAAPLNSISPLYAGDAREMTFVNDQKQYERRWIVDAHMQANQTIPIPQQFADDVIIGLINVDETYPP